jgi:hypothetical protein
MSQSKGLLDYLPNDILNEIISYLSISDLKHLGLTTSELTSVAKVSINKKLLKILKNTKINSTNDIPNLIVKLMNAYYGRQFNVRSSFDQDDDDLFLVMKIFDQNRSYSISLYLTNDEYDSAHEYYAYDNGPEWLFRLLFDNGLFERFKLLADEEIENESDD